jgi:hypothetical protein
MEVITCNLISVKIKVSPNRRDLEGALKAILKASTEDMF